MADPDPRLPALLEVFCEADWLDDAGLVDELPVGWSSVEWWAQSQAYRARWRWKRARVAWWRGHGVDILAALREQVERKQAQA